MAGLHTAAEPDLGTTPKPKFRRDKADIAIVAFGQIFQQVLTLGTGIVIARLLGAGSYGVLNLLRSLFTAVASISPLGLDLALLKFSGQNSESAGYVRATVDRLRMIAFCLNAAVALIIGFGFGPFLMHHVYPYEHFDRLLLVTLLGLPLATDLAILGAYYKGINKPGIFALLTIYLQPVVRVVMLGVAAFTNATTFSIVCINTAQLAVSLAALLFNLRRQSQNIITEKAKPADWPAIRMIFSTSIWMAASLFIYGMMRFVDILMLGYFATPKDVGEYGALATIAQLVQVYPLAASQTLGPEISRYFHAGDMDGVKLALGRYIHMASIIASFLFGGIAIFGDRLDLVFGHSFLFRPDVAFLMPLGYLLSATLAPTGYSLSMTGRHRGELVILVVGAISLVLLCALLIPIAGQIGAATASATSFMIINIVRFAYVSRVLHFAPGRLADIIPPFAALGCALAARLSIDAFSDRTLVATIAGCVVYSLLYCVICFVGLLRPQDRSELASFVKRRFK